MLLQSLSFALLLTASLSSEDYYWRNFNGTIPDDGFFGATNFGYNLYIGRAPLDTYGLLVGTIVSGLDNIVLTYGMPNKFNTTIHVVDRYLEILCSDHPENFRWISTSSENLLFINGLVRGGFEYSHVIDDIGDVFIGRSDYNIGKVDGMHRDNFTNWNSLYISNGTDEIRVDLYEVLVHKPN